MFLNDLTRIQQNFAEENHGLVLRFLHAKSLPIGDYYDVVLYGYVCAVRKYLSREDLRRRYDFDSIAFSAMSDELYKHYRERTQGTRELITVRVESVAYHKETLHISEIVSDDEYMREKHESKLIWEQVSRKLTHEQVRILHLRAEGYTDREIAARRKRQASDIESIFEDIQAAIFDLCFI